MRDRTTGSEAGVGAEADDPAKVLAVGDRVLWQGAFGLHAARPARVKAIVLGGKHGDPASDVPWDVVARAWGGRYVVVDLDNGHWAYGAQLQPVAQEVTA